MAQRTQHILQLPGGPSASVAVPVSSECTCYYESFFSPITAVTHNTPTDIALASDLVHGAHDPNVLRLQWLSADFPAGVTTGLRALSYGPEGVPSAAMIVPGISNVPGVIESQPLNVWRFMLPFETVKAWVFQNSGGPMNVSVTSVVWDMCGCTLDSIPC